MSSEKLFMLMRFNVLSFALTETGRHKISNAYLQAWEDSVYPSMHFAAHWHDGYDTDFDVTKEMMEEISKYLDDLWVHKRQSHLFMI